MPLFYFRLKWTRRRKSPPGFYINILLAATFRKILRKIYQSDRTTATLSSSSSSLGGQTDIFSQHSGLSREQNTASP